MTGPTEDSEFCFPSTLISPCASTRETLRVSGKQNSLFFLGPVVKCLLRNKIAANANNANCLRPTGSVVVSPVSLFGEQCVD